MIQVDILPYHVLNNEIVQKCFIVGCMVPFSNAHLPFFFQLHNMNIYIFFFILIHGRYFMYLFLWIVNFVQPRVLVSYITCFNKVYSSSSKWVLLFLSLWLLNQSLDFQWKFFYCEYNP